jgi:thiamine-phosphate pyrophosphorylase
VSIPRFYPITSPLISGLGHAAQVELFAAGGATLVQLRDKSAAAADFYRSAVESVKLARNLGIQIVINDRVDIALACDADGVHLGQDDMPPGMARKLLGAGRIIGFSTHSVAQAIAASAYQVDYIAIGPVFPTSTKENPDPVVGLESLGTVKKLVSMPVVGIGGITLSHARAVLDAGADSVAVISDLFVTGDITARIRSFIQALGRK